MRQTWAWADDASAFMAQSDGELLEALSQHHAGLMQQPPSESQRGAWRDELRILRRALRDAATLGGDVDGWSVVLEYELPMEGGRRPDIVLHLGSTIVVIEHKSAGHVPQAWIDQASAYARDLADYHERSHGRTVVPNLLLGSGANRGEMRDDVIVCGPDALAEYLVTLAQPGVIDLDSWLDSPYAPLPTLVAAARRIFEHEPLPHVRTALAAGIPRALDLLEELTAQAEQEERRILVFVTGVPGAGKTLVGLRYVYERSHGGQAATFLSGNGPLVEVLQDALRSRAFVRDLHAYIRSYGIDGKTPSEPIVVFDEAQRAWDREYMEFKRNIQHSEPDLLIQVGQRIEPWASFVGLVGSGQEIHSGEEGGIQQWRDAVIAHGDDTWDVHVPTHLAHTFRELDPASHDALDLDRTLRSRRAEDLHDWVALVLTGSHALAARQAQRVHQAGFALYLARDLEEARTYAHARYDAQPEARYGLLASSHAKRLHRDFGIRNHYMATSRMSIAKWFNASADDERSCCQLEQPLTEFGCQGLEVDLPIVCWGNDLLWDGQDWKINPINRKYPLDDPRQILENTYRVLLTRGRDGVVIWIPPHGDWDATELALLSAGVRPLPEDSALAGVVDAQQVAERRGVWRTNGA